jgi:hypothetical protein
MRLVRLTWFSDFMQVPEMNIFLSIFNLYHLFTVKIEIILSWK